MPVRSWMALAALSLSLAAAMPAWSSRPLAASGATTAGPGAAYQSCSNISVPREQLPLTLSIFTLSGNSVVPAGRLERAKLSPSVQFEDCGDKTFLGYTWGGEFYLVRRNEVTPQLSCTCVKRGADGNAGVAGMGRCAQCP